MDVIESPARPRRGRAGALLVAGIVGGVALAGFATASAQSPTPSTESDDSPATTAKPFGGGGRHGMGKGIHGEFVTADPDGGYQTIATQRGEVTDVSATSITVRSEDGYSRTYTVDDNTLVNAGNDGIGDVAKGDDVRVTAVVEDGKANAVEVSDGTNIERLRGRWVAPPAGSSASSSGTTTSSAT